MSRPAFRQFADSTAADWAYLDARFVPFERGLADRLMAMLPRLGADDLGYPVDRYRHSLQTATLALRAGADDETIVCALLHDIGDELAPSNHGALAADILAPYVSSDNAWMVRHHEIFQGYYYNHYFGGDRLARERHRGHPAFERTARFCDQWDQRAFDPAYDTLPLDAFRCHMASVFARAPWDGLVRD